MKDYPKMLKAFEKKHGLFADFKGSRESYFGMLFLFSEGWQAGKSFQKSAQRTLHHKAAKKLKLSGSRR